MRSFHPDVEMSMGTQEILMICQLVLTSNPPGIWLDNKVQIAVNYTFKTPTITRAINGWSIREKGLKLLIFGFPV